jgi:hypothetical protein
MISDEAVTTAVIVAAILLHESYAYNRNAVCATGAPYTPLMTALAGTAYYVCLCMCVCVCVCLPCTESSYNATLSNTDRLLLHSFKQCCRVTHHLIKLIYTAYTLVC